jgi:hypothetical protein
MTLKHFAPVVLLVALMLFASCKKEIQTESNINGAVIANNTVADDVLETLPPVHTPVLYNINSNVAGYYETLPARYHLTTKKYPMILFIHGIGELGTGLSRLNCCGLPYHIKGGTFPAKFLVNNVYYSYIVISPQFKVRPSAAQVQSVIDYAKNKYRIDETRVYVTGLSMGGGSTWDWSVVNGEKAAAIVPVCAGTAPTTVMATNVAAKNLPIWSLNSSADAVVPIQWAKDWITWIDARNTAMAPYTKLTVWDALSHNGTWGKAFNPVTRVDGYNIYEWMLLHQRSGVAPSLPPAIQPPPPPSGNALPVANAGTDRSIPVSWNYFPTLNATLSSDPDGWIAGFKWTKVSGPASYSFSNAMGAQTKVNGLVAGTYIFRVTVTDNKGAADTDDVVITMTSN